MSMASLRLACSACRLGRLELSAWALRAAVWQTVHTVFAYGTVEVRELIEVWHVTVKLATSETSSALVEQFDPFFPDGQACKALQFCVPEVWKAWPSPLYAIFEPGFSQYGCLSCNIKNEGRKKNYILVG